MAITMGTHVVIIDPAHLHYGKVGRVVGLAHMPPSGIVFTVDTGIEMVKAADYQLSTTVQDALDTLDSPPTFQRIADDDHEINYMPYLLARRTSKAFGGNWDYEYIGLPPVTNEPDGVE